ncbi:MAG: inaA protein [Candidatus Accumulibacter sp.]|uniref:lipopolysaccharide kinase InaA family protein n=1 Tax=Accumulibacter sp. TaxID=2053492 RepID=UPI001A5D63ED|nr:lipopolysaccharide kinase InaA family protein [Accumulibacter sp.]MBL8395016.1 inaA protein [Accumulibacter sp.]
MNTRDLFPHDAARQELHRSHLANFDHLWSLSSDWHEVPNQRRGGWSGVSRHVLADGMAIFVKRQENYLCRTLRHPLRGTPTFHREYQNILRLNRHAIGTLEALYYGDRVVAGEWRAILVTRALDQFISLDEWNLAHQPDVPGERQSLIAAIADACARLHHHHLQHGCLYGNHVFVRRFPESPGGYQESDVRFIDLEKLRRGISRRHAGAHDLDQLQRHTRGWTEDDWRAFRPAYRQRLAELRAARSARRISQQQS